jgi:IclR family transcriptional regulator, carbohydrate utilization repressor
MTALPTLHDATLASSSDAAEEPNAGQASAYAIQVIERCDTLMHALADYHEPMSLKQLSQATGLHASTAHRILNDLTVSRSIERTSSGEYKLGIRLLELGNLVKARLSVRDLAIKPMSRLHRHTGQTVNLSVRQGDEIVYIERAFSERSGMQVVRAIGGRAPLHLTSVGKLFLAADDDGQLSEYAQRTKLSGQTLNSLTTLSALKQAIGQCKQQGFATDEQELELGVRCIAVGIRDDSNQLVAGLSISAPADRLQPQWIKPLQDTALDISKALGFIPHS